MIKSLAHCIVNKIAANMPIDMDIAECYEYGLELLISKIVITSIIVLCGLLTDSLLVSILFSGAFTFLRQYTGGYHCKSAEKCIVVSVLIYLSFLIVYRLSSNHFSVIILVGTVISLFIIILMAPIASENKPITHDDEKKYRIIARITATVLLGFAFCSFFAKLNVIFYTSSWALIADAILLLLNFVNTRRVENVLEINSRDY